jgi:hypothetical protein
MHLSTYVYLSIGPSVLHSLHDFQHHQVPGSLYSLDGQLQGLLQLLVLQAPAEQGQWQVVLSGLRTGTWVPVCLATFPHSFLKLTTVGGTSMSGFL